MKKLDKALLGAAVAGLLSAMTAGSTLAADKATKEKAKAQGGSDIACYGVNGCKGKSSCAGAKSECGGKNGCKGEGWVKVSKEACDQLGGEAKPLPKM